MKTNYLTNVIDRYHRGWLTFVVNGDQISIPYLTRVKMVESTDNFELVEILEGKFANQKVEVPFLQKTGNDAYSYFTDTKIDFKRLDITINRRKGILTLGKNQYVVELSEKCKNGTYLIGFPIKKRIINKNYSDEDRGGTRFYDSWFPLIKKDEFNMSRFLHYGTFSEGCLTVSHLGNKGKDWSDIFSILMHSRINDDYLAQIKVY